MSAPRGKYIPPADGLHAEFFTRSTDGVLHLQRCSSCGLFRHPPAYYCGRLRQRGMGLDPV